MSRKIGFLLLSVVFLNMIINPVFADGNAVVLSDEELDQVYAQGFNFNFDEFLGNLDSILSSPDLKVDLDLAKGGTVTFTGDSGVEQQIFATETGDINYINLQDYAQQFANSLINVNAAGSNVLVGLNLTVLVNSVVNGDIKSYNFNNNSSR